MTARNGYGLVEAVVAVVLCALLAALFAVLLRDAARAAHHAGATADAADAVRTAAVLLSAELRPLDPHEDVGSAARDSLALRAFRGLGILCDPATSTFRYRGLRNPDPSKDSVIVLGAGRDSVVALAAATAGSGCTTLPGERLQRLTTTPALSADAAAGVVFEAGSYHLSSNALRYRPGRGGRQPLTADVLDDAGSAFTLTTASDPRGVSLLLAPVAIGWGTAGRWAPVAPVTAAIGFLNRPARPDSVP